MPVPDVVRVDHFDGLHYGSERQPATERRTLPQLRWLRNMVTDTQGNIRLPRGADLWFSVTDAGGTGDVRGIWWTGVLRNSTLVQTTDEFVVAITHPDHFNNGNPELHILHDWTGDTDNGAVNPANITGDSDRPAWVTMLSRAEIDGDPVDGEETRVVYVGGEEGTYRLLFDEGAQEIRAYDISNEVPNGRHSAMWNGRRFVVDFFDRVRFSQFGRPEDFDSDTNGFIDSMIVGGDSWGTDASSFSGEISALWPTADALLVFCTRAIWAITGSGPDNFHIRRLPGDIGPIGRGANHIYSLPDGGTAFFGGQGHAESGVYAFHSSAPTELSEPVRGIFDQWGRSQDRFMDVPEEPEEPERLIEWREEVNNKMWGRRFHHTYALTCPFFAGWLSVLTLNITTGTWSSFGGWGEWPVITVQQDYYRPQRWVIGRGSLVYESTSTFPRDPFEGFQKGEMQFGWYDEQRPSGLMRFIGFKVHGWVWGTEGDNPTISGVARVSHDAADETPEGDNPGSVEFGPLELPRRSDTIVREGGDSGVTFETAVIPINLRGAALDVDIEIDPKSSNTELLIEGVELVLARKPEKASRA